MTIGSISGTNNTQAGNTGVNTASDPIIKNLKKQISYAQKQLQELSSNKDMPSEEKTKRRQEIQQLINNLNQQLRQRQMELSKEQQTSNSSPENVNRENGKTSLSVSETKRYKPVDIRL